MSGVSMERICYQMPIFVLQIVPEVEICGIWEINYIYSSKKSVASENLFPVHTSLQSEVGI